MAGRGGGGGGGGRAQPHPNGESLVNLVERCLHFQADYGRASAAAARSVRGAVRGEEEEEAEASRRAGRRAELAQAAKIGARCVNDARLPLYHRGLGARLLACVLSRPEAPTELAVQAQESSVHLLDIMNQSSSGITREEPRGPVRLSPVDRHRVGVNCAAALAQLHAAVSGGGAAQVRGSVRHLDEDVMRMAPYPEAFSQDNDEDLADQRRRIVRAVLWHARHGGGAGAGAGVGGDASGQDFWTNVDGNARTNTRGSAMTRGSSSDYSLYSRGDPVDGSSDYNGDHLMPPGTASTGGSSAMLDPRDFYKQSNAPTHRPMTQYSELAGDMGLYDPDLREEMRVLRVRHDREHKDGATKQQHLDGDVNQELVDIELDGDKVIKGQGMFESLEAGMSLGYSPPSSPSPSQKSRRRLRSRAYRRSARGGGKSKYNNNMPQGSSTYTEFIRVMLSTPMQGPAARGLKHRHPAQNNASHPLNELSHSVRRNWTCMPEYLEALGVLSKYPIDGHQQSPKVQRMARKIKNREARSIQACKWPQQSRSGFCSVVIAVVIISLLFVYCVADPIHISPPVLHTHTHTHLFTSSFPLSPFSLSPRPNNHAVSDYTHPHPPHKTI